MNAMDSTQLHTDYSLGRDADSHALTWHDTPSHIVHRRLLERDGGEVARATSIVRYAAGASFEPHLHALGEEILVLDGTLTDETGDYRPDTYLQSPTGSQHAPFSR
jgi:anti-sigma factor ChrR (cupin superfamily)